jgi:hypothetical protein
LLDALADTDTEEPDTVDPDAGELSDIVMFDTVTVA